MFQQCLRVVLARSNTPTERCWHIVFQQCSNVRTEPLARPKPPGLGVPGCGWGSGGAANCGDIKTIIIHQTIYFHTTIHPCGFRLPSRAQHHAATRDCRLARVPMERHSHTTATRRTVCCTLPCSLTRLTCQSIDGTGPPCAAPRGRAALSACLHVRGRTGRSRTFCRCGRACR